MGGQASRRRAPDLGLFYLPSCKECSRLVAEGLASRRAPRAQSVGTNSSVLLAATCARTGPGTSPGDPARASAAAFLPEIGIRPFSHTRPLLCKLGAELSLPLFSLQRNAQARGDPIPAPAAPQPTHPPTVARPSGGGRAERWGAVGPKGTNRSEPSPAN